MSAAIGAHSYGHDLQTRDLNGIRVSETLLPAGLQLAEHAHEPGQICFVLDGSYRERGGSGEHILRPGMLQVHAPGEPHANDFPSLENVLVLLVSIDRERWINVNKPRPFAGPSLLTMLVREIRGELRRSDSVTTPSLEALVLLTAARVARLSERDESEPPWLSDAVALVERCHAEPLSLTSIANRIGVHRVTVAAAFRRYRGTSVGEMIRDERVRHAIRILSTSSVPLHEIALKTGFYDQAHFGRIFRRVTGMTPGEYRRTHH